MKKRRLFIFINITFLIFFSVFVSAGMSDVGVEYDNNLVGKFLVNHWTPVLVKVLDDTNITINHQEDSIELQKAKDTERNNLMIKKTEDVLSTLSKDEFQLERKSEFGGSFSGNITKEGFEKLLKDKRVKKIYDNSVSGHVNAMVITKNSLYLIPIFLLIILTILIIIKLKRKGDGKKKVNRHN